MGVEVGGRIGRTDGAKLRAVLLALRYLEIYINYSDIRRLGHSPWLYLGPNS